MSFIKLNSIDFDVEKNIILCIFGKELGSDMSEITVSTKSNIADMVKADVDNFFNIKPTHVLHTTDRMQIVQSIIVLSNNIAKNTRRGRGNTIIMNSITEKIKLDTIISNTNIFIDDTLQDGIIVVGYRGKSMWDVALAYKDGIYYDPNTPHHNWYDYFEVMYLEME